MISLFISLLVLIATFLQTKIAAKESGQARRSAVDWWNAEDELVDEHRFWWTRRRVRRELRTWRDPETDEAIRHITTVLVSWAMLLVASIAAVAKSIWDLIA